MPTVAKKHNVPPPNVPWAKLSFDRRDVAAILGVSIDTVDAEINAGRLKAHKIGKKRTRVTGEAIDQYRALP